MTPWTRTLNQDDAHTLLALAVPGMHLTAWTETAAAALEHRSPARRTELIRLVREQLLEWDGPHLRGGLFLDHYRTAPALDQLELLAHHWALCHPLPLLASTELVAPALERGDDSLPMVAVEAFVSRSVGSRSASSLRKTRTTLLGALEGVGALSTRGAGRNRSLHPRHGEPRPRSWRYLVARDPRPLRAAALTDSLAGQLTRCTPGHAARCLDLCVQAGAVTVASGEVRVL